MSICAATLKNVCQDFSQVVCCYVAKGKFRAKLCMINCGWLNFTTKGVVYHPVCKVLRSPVEGCYQLEESRLWLMVLGNPYYCLLFQSLKSFNAFIMVLSCSTYQPLFCLSISCFLLSTKYPIIIDFSERKATAMEPFHGQTCGSLV